MSDRIPSGFSEISASWLSARLGAGRVEHVDITPMPRWNVADLAHARVTVEGRAAPLKLFMKLRAEGDPLRHLLPGEAAFHKRYGAGDMPLAPLWMVLTDARTGASLLVFEDLRDSHAALPWPDPPSVEDACRAVASLARAHGLHARPWSAFSPREQSEWQAARRAARAEIDRDIPRFLAHMAEAHPTLSLDPLRDALRDASRDALRDGSRDGAREGAALGLSPVTRDDAWLTVVHGDFHPWNILLPRTGEGAPILIDWEYHRIDTPALDLANFLGGHVPSDWRRAHGAAVLDAYNRALPDGRWRLDRDDVFSGHRANADIPVHLWREGVSPERWLPHFKRWLSAAEDWAPV